MNRSYVVGLYSDKIKDNYIRINFAIKKTSIEL